MYLLDTNHCSRVVRGDETLVKRIDNCPADTVFTNDTVCGELYYMAFNSSFLQANLIAVNQFISKFNVISSDIATARVFGELKTKLFDIYGPRDKSRRERVTLASLGVSDNDMWIAATAIRHNLTLVSADSDFNRIKQAMDFPVESWI